MTTLNEARTAIYKRFEAEWVDGVEPLTPFCYDNEDFGPPVDDQGNAMSWARVRVRTLLRGQETLGKKDNRRFGTLAMASVEIFTRAGIGSKEPDRLTEKALSLFEGRPSPPGTNIRFNEVEPSEIGPYSDGRWWAHKVEARFAYDEIK